jgi:peptidoglycan/LPS O-acetylase OafA/YrhL
LRASAILLVLGFHYQRSNFGHPDWVTKLNNIGWTGVDLFFVLSGFLIASPLFQQINNSQTISIKNFYLKRFFRVIPVYLVVIAIYFYFPVFWEKEALPPLWKFLTFTQNVGLDQKNYGTFSHVWSLCVEEHFYLFFPIILIAFQQNKLLKRSYWILLLLFLIGFFIRSYCWNNLYLHKVNDANNFAYWMKYIYYPTYNRLDGLLAGVSIASIYQFSPAIWNKISKYGNQLIVMSLIILTTSFLFCSQLGKYSTAIIGFPVISIAMDFLC